MLWLVLVLQGGSKQSMDEQDDVNHQNFASQNLTNLNKKPFTWSGPIRQTQP